MDHASTSDKSRRLGKSIKRRLQDDEDDEFFDDEGDNFEDDGDDSESEHDEYGVEDFETNEDGIVCNS